MQTDFLVIGSGIAGLTFAIEASKYGSVAVITKKGSSEAATNYAQGGIASALSSSDTIESHIQDTLKTGDGLCKQEAVQLIAREAPSVVMELSKLGVKFTKTRDDKFDLGREGGHSARRIVHTKDQTGAEIERRLTEIARESRVNLFENQLAVDLILKNKEQSSFWGIRGAGSSTKRCIGTWVLDVKRDEFFPFFASSTIIATGGIGSIYLHTTNPGIATGDGISMAQRAGATIANMEFVQFHPTSFYGKKINGRAFLLSEAIRGEGGLLKTQDGNTFMEKYDSRRELAPRDIVARAIHWELKKRGDDYVMLDITHLDKARVLNKFPYIYKTCCSLGVDPLKEPIPVVPAAHYVCGGIVTDIDGRTNISGLFAAGEAACTGVHGANRLASNSLLESIVFARRAAKTFELHPGTPITMEPRSYLPCSSLRPRKEREFCEEKIVSDLLIKIRKLMWNKVGIIRNDKELREAKAEISQYKLKIEELYKSHRPTFGLIELRNVVTTASLVIECASRRQESRGLHFNIDHPKKDDLHYRKDTIF